MIVCHCKVVTDRDVRAAVDSGARTVRQLCGATGAGQDCGSCVFSLKRLLCEHGPVLSAASPVPEAEGAAS
jgi:bacterioferritin-associated ferredoxin